MSVDSASNDFTVYPAIDVRDGRVVRLRQGDYAQETRYGDDPCTMAEAYAKAGAEWLHLVDLDAARVGGYTLAPLLRTIKERTSLRVQSGGGVRSAKDVEAMLVAGADRVVVGSLAVRESGTVAGWIAHFGAERIAVALDTRKDANGWWRLPVHGWTEIDSGEAGPDLASMLTFYNRAGLRHLLCTDIERDGMLSGPNCALYERVCAVSQQVAVQASGGVRNADDVRAARDAGCAGVVLGRALLEGHVAVEEALAC
jgi:phosphoribosylformimino-5-aminoimidazole carboxamide ribotide isomerase